MVVDEWGGKGYNGKKHFERMVSMADYIGAVCKHLDKKEIKYKRINDKTLRIAYSGDNLDTIPINVIFDEDGDPYVALRCWDITKFKGSKRERGIMVCNELNNRFRWVKFSVDKDDDIVAANDAHVDLFTAGEEILMLVRRMVNIVDEAYPEFMKAVWG